MTRYVPLTTVAAAFVIVVTITPSWSQMAPSAVGPQPAVCVSPGCNPTVSDGDRNTAGGKGALANVGIGFGGNTAFGAGALFATTTTSTSYQNTAIGIESLTSNDTGHGNVAIGAFALRSN